MSLTPEQQAAMGAAISRLATTRDSVMFGKAMWVDGLAAGIAAERARCAKLVCYCCAAAINHEAPADGGQPGESK